MNTAAQISIQLWYIWRTSRLTEKRISFRIREYDDNKKKVFRNGGEVYVKLENDEPMIGMELTAENAIRLVPDILIRGVDYYFPAFTSCEEMGEYGEVFSKVQKHIMEIINLARNNEKNVKGVVVDAFTNSFVLPAEWFQIVEDLNRAD